MATTKSIGNIKKTRSVPTASIGTANANLDQDVVFNNHIAVNVRWAGITIGGSPGTVQFAASTDGTNFSLIGSATTLTAAGNVVYEDQNFEGIKARIVYTSGTETDATGSIDADFLAEKPL